MLTQSVLVVVLLFLFYQDMRYRGVYWVVFPALLIGLCVQALQHLSWSTLIINGLYNLAFLLVQLLLLSAYLSLRKGRIINITSSYLGWGDVLFLIAIAFYLSPVNYLFFYILSLAFTLLVTLLWMARDSGPVKIPLAGLQALLFAFFIIGDWSSPHLNLLSDSWLLNYLN